MITFLVILVVGLLLGSILGWLTTSQNCYLGVEHKWNWRVLLGPWAYHSWLKENRG